MYKMSFIGTGNMAGALVAAAAAGGYGADCLLTNRTPEKARALAAQHGCAVGQGMTLVTPDALATREETDELCRMLAAAGRFDSIDESLMDAGTVIAGCTGAWVDMLLDALADGAVETGLPRAKARQYAAQAVLGAAALALDSGKHPGQLKDEVCSPAGSTVAGVHALERAGLRGAAMDAVTAAFARTREMGKS